MRLVAISLTAVLLSLAVVHLYWMVRGVGTSAGVPSRPDGEPLFRPGRVACLMVALALGIAALIVVGRARLMDVPLSPWILRAGTWGIAATFAARTVGEFRYVGLFKRVRGTLFARWDSRVFTPLCGAIAGAAGALAIS